MHGQNSLEGDVNVWLPIVKTLTEGVEISGSKKGEVSFFDPFHAVFIFFHHELI